MLDQELWLRPEQREPLRQLVEHSQPVAEEFLQDRPGDREQCWLAHVFLRIDEAGLSKILDTSQQAQWKLLKKSFVNAGANQVTILLQSGTTLSLPLMPRARENGESKDRQRRDLKEDDR